jgi:hypothetical protein
VVGAIYADWYKYRVFLASAGARLMTGAAEPPVDPPDPAASRIIEVLEQCGESLSDRDPISTMLEWVGN